MWFPKSAAAGKGNMYYEGKPQCIEVLHSDIIVVVFAEQAFSYCTIVLLLCWVWEFRRQTAIFVLSNFPTPCQYDSSMNCILTSELF